MRKSPLAILAFAAIAAAPGVAQPPARATPGTLILHQMPGFEGASYAIESDRTTVDTDWNVRSISIAEGETWQICARPRFRDCIELSQSLPDASAIGITGQIGSARRVSAN